MTDDHSTDIVTTRSMFALVLFALLLRFAVLHRDAEVLRSDPDAYVRLAESVASGNGFSVAGSNEPTAFRPVLYPLALASTIRAGIRTETAVAFWNLLSGALLIPATVLLAKSARLGRVPSIAAGFCAAIDPLMLRYTAEPMTECISAALITLTLLAFVRYIQTSFSLRWGILAGLAVGLSALCRPVAYVTCVVLTLVLIVLAACRQEDRRKAILRALLPGCAAAVTVSPWILRNAVEFGHLIPATTHGGYTLLLGNNPVFFERVVSGKQEVWDGDSLDQWQQSLLIRRRADGISDGDELGIDRWMYAEAFGAMRDHPAMTVQASLLRWKSFWALTPTASTVAHSSVVTILLTVWYSALGIGLVGSISTCFRKSPQRTAALLLWAAVASFLLIHTFYWTNTRMRAPVTGALVVLSVMGWSRWIDVLGRVRRTAS